MQVLGLNIAGSPFRWLTTERAAYHIASGKVAWSLGESATVFHGGVNRQGRQSILEIPSVIALAKSETMVRHMQNGLPLDHGNELLFRRDRNLCAYCGNVFERFRLTRDHVFPRARGGRDEWANVVTACRGCNMGKGCRTPEEARMPLLYVPYEPCRFEHFILSSRGILADQMDFLASRLPRHSRIFK